MTSALEQLTREEYGGILDVSVASYVISGGQVIHGEDPDRVWVVVYNYFADNYVQLSFMSSSLAQDFRLFGGDTLILKTREDGPLCTGQLWVGGTGALFVWTARRLR